VTIIWSITSGKRQISMDGREIHYSTNRASILDFSWQTKGNHVIKVICHAAPPLSATPGFRQYDLLLDGQSFFGMPKVFQLGIKGPIPSQVPNAYTNPISPVSMGSSLSREMPVSREQEDEDLRRAIEASIRESRTHLGESRSADERSAYTTPHPTTTSNGTGDLLDLGGVPPAPGTDSKSVSSMPSYYSAPPSYGNHQPYSSPAPYQAHHSTHMDSGALVPAVAPPGYYQAPPPAGPSFSSPSHNAGAPYGYGSPPPVPPAPAPTPAAMPYNGGNSDLFGLNSSPYDDPFAPRPPPPPSHNDLASAILASYASPPGVPVTPMAGSQQNGFAQTPDTMQSNGSGPNLSMNGLALTVTEEAPKSEFEKALQKLVNIDHIDEPAEGEVKLTMIKKEEATAKALNGKSRPKPPVGVGFVGQNAPLAQIKQTFESPPKTTTEGIMNAPPAGAVHPNSQYAGALVVHGQGPPPLHQAQGFGVGRLMPGGGFQNQQPMQPGYIQQQANPQFR
jgi:hypothetical protein